MQWFRLSHPHGTIETEEIEVTAEWARYKAIVWDGQGGQASAYGTERASANEDYCEVAGTRAVGRALSLLGFNYNGEDLSEGEHVADAPVTTIDAPDAAHEATGISSPHPLPVGEGGTPGAATNGHKPAQDTDEALAHPTESHLAALKNLACTECGDPIEVYEDRLRRTMGIPKNASVAPKLLTRTMTMQAYMEVFGFYRRLEAQLAKGKEGTNGTQNQGTARATTTPAPTEATHADPSPPAALSSAPEPSPEDAAERDRVRLRAEVSSWNLRISDKEREYVIAKNSYSRARQLLWQNRVDAPAATPIEAAAD
jgi:hypothetical protein